MGCGCNRDQETGIDPKLSAALPSPPKARLIDESLDKLKTTTDGELSVISDVAVTPAQFVVKNTGTINKNYVIKKKLGEGSFGVVYEAIHKETGQKRAIKYISRSSASLEDEVKILKEIQILKQMDHPNIVKLYEFYADSHSYYMVTELVEGGELFDEIERHGHFTEEDAAVVLSQMLSAVIYCHERRIVHRDIKPENILLEKVRDRIQLKVIDFGTAQMFGGAKKLTSTTGTAYYIAPEVLSKRYDEKCDVWSCGVILYILLCGMPPFNGNTDDDILKAVRRGKFAYNGTMGNYDRECMGRHFRLGEGSHQQNAQILSCGENYCSGSIFPSLAYKQTTQ
eukprot:TRINITY_DN1304_c0_g2_i3.p1 TRINITY_DN1304_c0_g2~~TRINITY_DN1304_c0_g2_i3.p1  ORF type:complete len:340 (+),score=71.15 TRINITY_DN1304_c0_g2_i3:122-1141(+)